MLFVEAVPGTSCVPCSLSITVVTMILKASASSSTVPPSAAFAKLIELPT